MFETPILFIVFNRPDTTQQVFNVIKRIKPKYLFVVADGPRPDVTADIEKCKRTRLIVEQVDWHCEIKTLFLDQNKGCGRGPAEAITWFFEYVDEGIILEDDCVPHIEFFSFCEETLSKYRSNTSIVSIAGSNFQKGIKRGDGSYYFSVHNRIWGWATWKRTWENYDYYLKNIEENEMLDIINSFFRSKNERSYWLNVFKYSKGNQTDNSAWDFQFMFLLWKLRGLTVTPNVNLVSNIGYGENATHTSWGKDNPNLNIPTQNIYPINHPKSLVRNRKADEYYFSKFIRPPSSLGYRLKRKLNKYMAKIK